MKTLYLSLVLGVLGCSTLQAQTTQPALVSQALQAPTITYITDDKPAADAKFYVYLCSASWCPPCRAIMPKIVAEYPQIKAAGGEIILLCFDSTQAAGVSYLKKYNASFPTMMANGENMRNIVKNLPGFTPPRGIPFAVFVTADGKVLSKGHGNTVLNWKEITNK